LELRQRIGGWRGLGARLADWGIDGASALSRQPSVIARHAAPRAHIFCQATSAAPRKSLLLGTTLASALALGAALAPTPAHAVDCFAAATPPPGASGPIIVFPPVNDFITCTNTDDRFNNPALPQAGAVIRLSTTGDLHSIDLDNSAI
jgi:hypothetical protein